VCGEYDESEQEGNLHKKQQAHTFILVSNGTLPVGNLSVLKGFVQCVVDGLLATFLGEGFDRYGINDAI